MNRSRRIWGVVGAVGVAAALWMVAVPLLGHRLTVTGGPPGRERLEIGLAPVVIVALAAALAGWALLALLERVLPRSARLVWTITALGVLLVSFAPLATSGMDVATRVILGALHVAVATVLIAVMTRTAAHPGLSTVADADR
ncbi:hypothetical protein FHG89_26065 [Micromonospora orduensis]|uniref:Uncharacterized protein n=1 Tax=Micromonospora orduensis TaxID=1420891 RepID=A0A5C4QCK8_9ACTN|nr:DUF6069 family protein [Micromonospora orduensis]TNH23976.1 hypothetical protein FHG89_26065 [Micromonospora orduensis]